MQQITSRTVLVVAKNPELVEIVRRAGDSRFAIEYAPDEPAGLRMVAEKHPDIIVLGYLDPQEETVKFYRRLKEGWISRHSPVVVVELNVAGSSHRIMSDEDLLVCGEHTFLSGSPAPLLNPDELSSRLKDIILKMLLKKENKFKADLLDPDCFCLTLEQIPGPGAFETRQEIVLENARKAAAGRKFCALTITDNPGGTPAIATDIVCSEIKKMGIEPLVHIALRDRSRNQAESLLFQLAALDINNVLILTGDYPSNLGFNGRSMPVFDLDSVNGLRLIQAMNRGLEREIMRKQTRLAPTDFFTGVAFSPFKQMEAEVMGQYYKLKQKIAAGANFTITQVGYDVRKLHELKRWLDLNNYHIPVLAGIYVLSYPVAVAMHANNIPGCVVTDKLLKQLAVESESPDKGRAARLERAAKMFAIVKGLGYRGAYISGQGLPYESAEYVVKRGNEMASAWQEFVHEFDFPQENSFYYFEKNPENGLNIEKTAPRLQKTVRPFVYRQSLALHALIFDPGGILFKPVRGLSRFLDTRSRLKRIFHKFEYLNKTVLYSCKDCGDCALFDVAYLCPVSQCPKDQRNGPCGGSFEGWCEVYPGEKQCIWVRAYQRLKSRRQEDSIGLNMVPPLNWELWQTSSWINYFLARDHVSRRLGIKPPEKRPSHESGRGK